MKRIVFLSILLVLFNHCSLDDDPITTPPASVQTPISEPEPEPVVVQYTLTVTTSEGGSVSEGGTFDEGTEVTITATSNSGYEFIGWEGSDSSEPTLTISLNSNITISASFQTI